MSSVNSPSTDTRNTGKVTVAVVLTPLSVPFAALTTKVAMKEATTKNNNLHFIPVCNLSYLHLRRLTQLSVQSYNFFLNCASKKQKKN